MTLSNPAGASGAEATAYTDALLALLGDRDPVAVLDELLPWLERRLSGVPEERLRRPEAPNKWSVVEVVQHLADSELVFGFRIRMVLTADRPPIPAYDQDAWAQRLRYRDVPLARAIEQLRALRAMNRPLYADATPAELRRVGIHAERGEESLEHMVRMFAGHDLAHRRQIERILG